MCTLQSIGEKKLKQDLAAENILSSHVMAIPLLMVLSEKRDEIILICVGLSTVLLNFQC